MKSFVFSTGLLMAALVLCVCVCAPPQGQEPFFPLDADMDHFVNKPEMPDTCSKETNYCFDKHPLYPQELINYLLDWYQVSLAHPHEINVGRNGFELEKQNDCKKNVTYSPIHEIVDEDGNVRVVVQADTFKQQMRVEKCQFPGQLTRRTQHFSEIHLKHHRVNCINHNATYKFLVLSLDGKKFESLRSSEIPISCVCEVQE